MPYAYIEIFEHLYAALWLFTIYGMGEVKITEILIHARSTIKCQGLCRFRFTMDSEMASDMVSASLSQACSEVHFAFEMTFHKCGHH